MQLMVLSDESLSYWATNFHLRSILFWGVAGLRNITEIFLHVFFFYKRSRTRLVFGSSGLTRGFGDESFGAKSTFRGPDDGDFHSGTTLGIHFSFPGLPLVASSQLLWLTTAVKMNNNLTFEND